MFLAPSRGPRRACLRGGVVKTGGGNRRQDPPSASTEVSAGLNPAQDQQRQSRSDDRRVRREVVDIGDEARPLDGVDDRTPVPTHRRIREDEVHAFDMGVEEEEAVSYTHLR